MAKSILALQELSCNEKNNNAKSSNEESNNKGDDSKKSNFTYVDENNRNHEHSFANHILSLSRRKSPRHIRIIQYKKRRCVNCGCRFYPKKHILNQRYCSKKECQSVRKNAWRRHKLKHDQDYRDNKKAAHLKWKLLHPDYWKNYKKKIASSEASNIKMSRKVNFKVPVLRILVAKSTLNNLRKAKAITCVCRLSCSKK